MKIIEQNKLKFTESLIVYKLVQQGARVSDVSGGGDMLKAVYDPGSANADAFDMDNMAEGDDTKIMTDSERTNLGNQSGTNSGDQDLSVKFDKSGGRDLEDFSEKGESLTFTAGAATLPVDTCDNSQNFTLTENSAITTSGTPVTGKPITLWVTHSGGAWTLSWNGTDLELEGAEDETETVLIVYNGAAYIVNRGGVVDLTI